MRWNVKFPKKSSLLLKEMLLRIVGEESISMPRIVIYNRIVVDLCMRVAADRQQSSVDSMILL